MYQGKTVAVVVPAYNEETQIERVIRTMPDFVDRIVVVNDHSNDRTSDIVINYIKEHGNHSVVNLPIPSKLTPTIYNKADIVLEKIREEDAGRLIPSEVFGENCDNDRIILINHQRNGGVGAAISTGYMWCRNRRIDCTAVMAGDGQMDPDELHDICAPALTENIDYVKGNRLSHQAASRIVPKTRFLGNSVLSLLTKVASGYWYLSDTQTGYTAISLGALDALDIPGIYPSYGMPNDMLVKLNMAYCTIREVPINPIYQVGEQSKMKIFKVIPKISCLLLKLFFKRLWDKYFIKNFHPLFLFYMFGITAGALSFVFLIYIIYNVLILQGSVNLGVYITFLLLFVSTLQSIGFAMFMDIQDNEKLQK